MSILDLQGVRVTSVDDGAGGRGRVAGVNLMPPEILAGRAFRRTQKLLAAAALCMVAAVAGVYVTAVHDAAAAADELAVVQATGTSLRAQQARYADVPRVAKAIDEAKAARETAMAQDVDWSRYLAGFSLTVPKGVWFTSLDLHLGSSGGTAATPAVAATGTASATATAPTAALAAVTIDGVATTLPDVAAWIDSLGGQEAVTAPFVSTAQKVTLGDREVVDFASSGDIGYGALSHRFDRKAG